MEGATTGAVEGLRGLHGWVMGAYTTWTLVTWVSAACSHDMHHCFSGSVVCVTIEIIALMGRWGLRGRREGLYTPAGCCCSQLSAGKLGVDRELLLSHA